LNKNEDDKDEQGVPLLMDPELPTLKEVLEAADVVLQVLDARDPLPYRSQWVEDRVKWLKGKHFGFILNKIGESHTERAENLLDSFYC
jgi:nuclear GTP-binding protein